MLQHNPVPIFLSSAHYGLEDLRGELASHLQALGTTPFVSSEIGFPDSPGMPPYVQCLKVLERSLIVVGIIDRRYGAKFESWEPYPQYANLSPTHAELRHALAERKRLLVYVREDVQAFYELYRKNKTRFGKLDLPNGLQVESLALFEEMKRASPAPWIEAFRDVRDIKSSIANRLHHDLHEALLRREEETRRGAEVLLRELLLRNPELQGRLSTAIKEVAAQDQKELRRYLGLLGERPQEAIQAQPSVEENILKVDDGKELISFFPSEPSWEVFKGLLTHLMPLLLDDDFHPSIHLHSKKVKEAGAKK